MHQSAKVLLEARRDKKEGEKRKKEKGRRREMTKKRERERKKVWKEKEERKCVGCIDRGFKLHRHQKRPTVFEVQQG